MMNAQNPVQSLISMEILKYAGNTISLLGTPVFVNDRTGAVKGALRLTNKVLNPDQYLLKQ